jgi:hypothetical protein
MSTFCCVCGKQKPKSVKAKEWRKKPEEILAGNAKTRSRSAKDADLSEICPHCRRENARMLAQAKAADQGRKQLRGAAGAGKKRVRGPSKADSEVSKQKTEGGGGDCDLELQERPRRRLRFANDFQTSRALRVLDIVQEVTAQGRDPFASQPVNHLSSPEKLPRVAESPATPSRELAVQENEPLVQTVAEVRPRRGTGANTGQGKTMSSRVNHKKRTKSQLEQLARNVQKQSKELKRKLERESEGKQKAKASEERMKELLARVTASDLSSLEKITQAQKLLLSQDRLDVFERLAEALVSGRLPLNHLIYQRFETTLNNLFKDSTKQHRYSDVELSYFSVLSSLPSGSSVVEFMRGIRHGGDGKVNHATDLSKVNEFVPSLQAIAAHDKMLDKKNPDDADASELGLSKSRIREAVSSQPPGTQDVFLGFDYTDVREELYISPASNFAGDHDLSSTPIADGYDPQAA